MRTPEEAKAITDPVYFGIGEMKPYQAYKVKARNFNVAVWFPEGYFVGIRQKFNAKYPDREFHYDTGAPHGTVKPLEIYNAVV